MIMRSVLFAQNADVKGESIRWRGSSSYGFLDVYFSSGGIGTRVLMLFGAGAEKIALGERLRLSQRSGGMDYENISWITALAFTFDLLVRVGLCLRVIMRRISVGTSLAWLTIIMIFPFGGGVLYVLLGEKHLGKRRARRAAQLHPDYLVWLKALCQRANVLWSQEDDAARALSRLAQAAVDIPALQGNHMQLIGHWKDALQSIIDDIERAHSTIHLEFYIWYPGGMADEVAAALVRARQRNVICRVLLDAVGSKEFFRSPLAVQLRAAGVELRSALPSSLIRMWFVRLDLRLHRKIVLIDGEVAYTGSLNLVDPRYFKQDSGVGQWVDAMARVEGPAVEALAITFVADWELETGEGPEQIQAHVESRALQAVDERGAATVQVIPSGPEFRPDAIYKILITTIYSARRELVLTSPYFVPDEALLTALASAANRGVAVTLIVPKRVDSHLVRFASQAHQGDLLAAGVRIFLFDGGLLHTKSVTVDGRTALFGSLNLDPRSIWLNFEITLAVYNPPFAQELRALQQTYLDDAEELTLDAWCRRSFAMRFAENAARLVGPLL
jgi:cardiolipin synthase